MSRFCIIYLSLFVLVTSKKDHSVEMYTPNSLLSLYVPIIIICRIENRGLIAASLPQNIKEISTIILLIISHCFQTFVNYQILFIHQQYTYRCVVNFFFTKMYTSCTLLLRISSVSEGNCYTFLMLIKFLIIFFFLLFCR
jgi:hypothetical protein